MPIPSGYTALDFVGFTDKKAYANNVTYVINDIVDYRGEKWICKIDNTIGVTPGENANWTLWMGAPVNLVERIIAPLEENPATIAYGVGRQIIYDDYLYEVIKQINVGDTLVVYDPLNPSPSANIKLAPPVETQVLAIKAEADATDDMIAPTETNASASSQPYGVGEQLILNNVLYTVTSAIAQNGPLVISGAGQNLTASKSLTDQLADKADSDVVDGALALKANKTDIAPIEGTTFSQGYAIGEQFYHGGTLYKALTAITSGTAWSSLVEDTNYEECDINTRVGSQIQALTNNDTAFTNEISVMNNILGSKNLLPNYGKSQTINGVQITVAPDGSYTLEGTNSGSYAEFILVSSEKGFTLPAGTYKFSGVFATQSGAKTGNIAIEYTDDTVNYCTGESSTFTLSAAKTIRKVRHSVSAGYTFHAQVYPMLRLASIADDTYVPYSETNKQLTDATVFEEGTPTINTTNFTDYGSWVAKFGKLIFLYVVGKIEFATTGSNVELMTLSSDFKPTKGASILAAINENNVGTLSVNNNGKVTLYMGSSAQGWTLRGVLIAIK